MGDPVVRVNGIDHVVFHVKDIERSKRFYMDVLGFTWRHELERPGFHMSFLSCGSQGLDLCEVPDADIHGGAELNHMALRLVEGEREEVVSKLAAVGVKVFGRDNDPSTMYLDDPDGHRIQLLSVVEQQEVLVRETARAASN